MISFLVLPVRLTYKGPPIRHSGKSQQKNRAAREGGGRMASSTLALVRQGANPNGRDAGKRPGSRAPRARPQGRAGAKTFI